MSKIPCSWIKQTEISKYYRLSLEMEYLDYMLMYGDMWESFYIERAPTLSGFIAYYKNFIKSNIYETIVKRVK